MFSLTNNNPGIPPATSKQAVCEGARSQSAHRLVSLGVGGLSRMKVRKPSEIPLLPWHPGDALGGFPRAVVTA
jgi:hypothetical protein